ncbi:MAG: DoxX family protein [Thermoplasmatota archaeon]
MAPPDVADPNALAHPAVAATTTETETIVWARHAHWLLRFALASIFVYHGVNKFRDLDGFATMMDLSGTTAFFVALAETAGGAAVFLGGFKMPALTRLGGLVLIPVMVGAIVKLHWPRWSFTPAEGFPMGGMEFQVAMILLAAYFVVRGNGDVTQSDHA